MALFTKKTKDTSTSSSTKSVSTEKKEVKKSTKKESVKKDEKGSMKDLYVKKEASSKKEEKVNVKGNAYKILVKPLITEKASIMAAENKYFFSVSRNANKLEVAQAIEEVYGVKPTSVNTVNYSGKKVRSGKITGKRSDWKKAIITLPKGNTINVYEGV